MKPVARPRTVHAVVALGITQIIGWGTTFYLPAILSRPIADALGLPLLGVLGAYSWALLLSGLLARRVGMLIDRYGAAPLLAGASVLAACALALHSQADGPVTIWLAWSLIGLGMRAMLYDGAFAALAALEGAGARRPISILTLFGGLASTVFWPISHWLLESLGWRDTLLVYALLNLLVCAPLHYRFAGCRPSAGARKPSPALAGSSAHSPDAAPEQGSSATATRWAETAVLLLATAFAFHASIWSSLAVHMPELLRGLGLDAGAAVTVAALLGPAQVLARSAELFAQRWLAPLALAVPVFALLPLSLLALVSPLPAAVAALSFVLVYGCSNGLITILRGALPLTIVGARGFGELLGRVAAPSLVVSAISPLAFAQVLAAWGFWPAAGLLFAAGIACTIVAAALVRHVRSAPAG